MRLEVGTQMCHKQHGLVEVRRIDHKHVGDKSKEFATLACLNSHLAIMVPTDDADQHVRPLLSKEQLDRLFVDFKKPVVDQSTWNQRYRLFMDQLNTGSFVKWLDVAGKLVVLRQTKDLSFGERKMLDLAVERMSAEIASVTFMSRDGAMSFVIKTLDERCGKA